jgi:hypothetical protein
MKTHVVRLLKIPLGLWAVWLALTVLISPLGAQTDSGTIRGVVSDTTGAVVSGAAVTLSNTETTQVRSIKSSSTGAFDFESVQRGQYKVHIDAPGFQAEEQLFELQVSQTQSLLFSLKPGSEKTTVTITDAAPVVDISTSSTGLVIEAAQITDLPLNGRNFTSLALLTPGVTRGAYGSEASGVGGNSETFRYGETGGAALSVNGLRQQADNFELDGVDNNEMLVGTIVFFPPVEATQEFRINTTLATAEFGGAGGAMVQSSIKSGTNQYHGSAFFFDRDQIFDANPNYNFEGVAGGIRAPTFHRIQLGGTAGGPIWRNRLFLFGDYQGLRQRQPQGERFLTVPTALMRTGNFSEFLNPALTQGNSIPGQVNSFWIPVCNQYGGQSPYVFGAIVNPLTCQPFQGNIIPSGQLNQAGLNYLNAYPLPTPSLAGKTVVQNYEANPSQTQRFDDFDVRLDANITAKDTAFARYSYGQDILQIDSQLPKLPSGFGAGYNPTHPRGLAIGETHVISPNLVNEARFGYIRPYYAYINPFDNVALATQLGIPGANTSMEGGLGIINSGFTEAGDAGPYEVPQKTIQVADSISWTKNNHTFKFGADIMHHQVKYFQIPAAKGQWNYANNFTGYSGADVLAGFVNDFEAGAGVPQGFIDTRNWYSGFFAQDDWKVNRRLTVNLGMRWEEFTHPIEANNNQSNFDLATLTLLVAGKNGNSRALVGNQANNFGPRIGFAYDLTGKGTMSLRGGYGIFYFQERGGGGNGLWSNPDFNGEIQVNDWAGSQSRIALSGETPVCSATVTTNCQSSPNYNNNVAAATGPLPFPQAGVLGTLVNPLDPTGVALISQDPHSPTSMVQEWNVQIQRQLDHATSVTVGYVGTKSDHLLTAFNLNEQENGYINGAHAAYEQILYPAFESIQRIFNEGTSNDNALEITLQRSMYKGLQLTGAYTWSHALDDSDGAIPSGGSDSGIEITNGVVNLKGPMGHYGNSDQDIRSNFSFSALGELPFGRGRAFGQHLPRALDYAVGGWQLNTIVHLQTGTPFDATTGKGTIAGDTNSCSCEWAVPNERTDLTGKIKYKKSIFEWFDYTQFTPPPATWVNGVGNGYPVYDRQGTLGRNQLYGPSFRTLDASIFKNFAITEKVNAQFRAQAYNLANTPQFTNPNGQVSPTYNIPTAGANGIPALDNGDASQITGVQLHSERQLELALRVIF